MKPSVVGFIHTTEFRRHSVDGVTVTVVVYGRGRLAARPGGLTLGFALNLVSRDMSSTSNINVGREAACQRLLEVTYQSLLRTDRVVKSVVSVSPSAYPQSVRFSCNF